MRAACAAGVPRGVVLMDAAYGNDTRLCTGISAPALTYVAGIPPNTMVWAPGTAPLPAKRWSGRGRPPKRIRRDREHRPISVKALALGLPANAWRTIGWREGTADWLCSRFARLRVRVAPAITSSARGERKSGFLIEWPTGESQPPSTDSPPSLMTPRSLAWSTWPNCAGESSAITRSSSKNSGLGTTKGAAGAASITMPGGQRFPPQDLVPPAPYHPLLR